MRLHKLIPEYEGRVRVVEKPFPLEVLGGESAPQGLLEQEWWIAAIQEPAAEFAPYEGDDWPTTTLPAFEAAWCAFRQGEEIGHDYDLRVRRAFFAQSRNIGKREVLLEIAGEAGLDMQTFERDFSGEEARRAVLEELRIGQERYDVRGTPTVMLPDGKKLRHPISIPRMKDHDVVGVRPLSCYGEGCLDETRKLFEEALARAGSGEG